MAGLRDKILAANDVESELVEIPGMGSQRRGSLDVAGNARAHRPDGKRSRGSAQVRRQRRPRLPASVVIATAFDPETGEALFTADDIAALNNKNAAAVGKLSEVGARLSGLTDEAKVEAGKD